MVGKTITAVALLVLISTGAWAQQATVGELSQLNAANILKDAQLTGAQLDAKLRKASAGEGSTAASDTVISSPAHTDGTAAAKPLRPVVKGVFGANGTLYATLLYADGTTVDAKQGTSVPGGYVVAHVDADRVALRRGKQLIDIGFSSTAPVEPATPATPPGVSPFGSVIPMPPMPSPVMPAAPSSP